MKKRLLCLCLAFSLILGLFAVAPAIRAASSMKASEDLIAVIKEFEGFSGTPYLDSDGKYTIGYGTRCPDDLVDQYNETPMTEEEADAELRAVIVTYEKDVNDFIDKNGLSYSQRQFDAVVSLIYNVGSSWLKKGSTLVKALTNGATGNELIYAFSIYSMSNGVRSVGHIRRRLAEASIYLDGHYSRTAPDNYCFVLYDAQGGTISAMDGNYNVQGYDGYLTAEPVATASREGYLFKGWFTSSSGGTQITVLNMDTKSATLYAQWEAEGADPSDPTEPAETTAPSTEPPAPTEPEPTIPEGTPIDPVKVNVTGNQVNVRKGPGLSYEAIGTVNKGDQLTITATYENDGYLWGKSAGGWVALQNTDYGKEPEAPTDPTEPEKPTDPPAEPSTAAPTEPSTQVPTEPEEVIPEGTPIDPVKVKVTVKQLNVRKGPGTSYAVVAQLSSGDEITVTATYKNSGYLWGRFEKGWAALENTSYAQAAETPTAPEPTDPEPTDPEPTEPDVTEPEITEPEPTEPEMPPEGMKLYATVVKTKSLNVRKVPKGAVVGALYRGDRVEILEQRIVDGVLWGRCEKGWINMRTYVQLETVAAGSDETIQPGDDVQEPEVQEPVIQDGVVPPVVQAPGAKTRVMATIVSTGSQVILAEPEGTVVGKLDPGDKVEILERTYVNGRQWGRCAQGWIRIRSNVKIETIAADDTAQSSQAEDTGIIIKTYAEVVETEGIQVSTAPDGESCGSLSLGDRVEILEYQIQGDDLWGHCAEGWIRLRDLVKLETVTQTADPTDPAVSFDTVTIKASCLNIRSEAGNSNCVVCRLYEGTTVAVREMKPADGTIWARIDMGWINMDYLV